MIFNTFWEGDKIPGYLSLCVSTWYRQVDDLSVKNVSWTNWDTLVGDALPLYELQKQRLAKQNDAVSALTLARRGGMFLDVDTILMPPVANSGAEPFWSEPAPEKLRFYGSPGGLHVAVINAGENTSSPALDMWIEDIQSILLENSGTVDVDYWASMAPAPLQNIRNTHPEYFEVWDRTGAVAEELYWSDKNLDEDKKSGPNLYREFYFSSHDIEEKVEFLYTASPTGLILLHNSWTPDKFLSMSVEEFLDQEIVISRLLKDVADIDRALRIEKDGLQS